MRWAVRAGAAVLAAVCASSPGAPPRPGSSARPAPVPTTAQPAP